VIQRLSAEVKTLLDQASMRERLVELGSENIWAGPEATDNFVRAEFERWGPIVRQAGVTNN
jgi:tripartite-type tricarboxylate transporter receptor subunit TctC